MLILLHGNPGWLPEMIIHYDSLRVFGFSPIKRDHFVTRFQSDNQIEQHLREFKCHFSKNYRAENPIKPGSELLSIDRIRRFSAQSRTVCSALYFGDMANHNSGMSGWPSFLVLLYSTLLYSMFWGENMFNSPSDDIHFMAWWTFGMLQWRIKILNPSDHSAYPGKDLEQTTI